jgi:hypothetical protein
VTRQASTSLALVVLQLRHMLFGSGLFRERPGQHEFGLEHRAPSVDEAVERRRHPFMDWVQDLPLQSLMAWPVLRSYQVRLRSSVTVPSWTTRLPERSSGSASPRFSRQRRRSKVSSAPMMIRASDPPMKCRRSCKCDSAALFARIIASRVHPLGPIEDQHFMLIWSGGSDVNRKC